MIANKNSSFHCLFRSFLNLMFRVAAPVVGSYFISSMSRFSDRSASCDDSSFYKVRYMSFTDRLQCWWSKFVGDKIADQLEHDFSNVFNNIGFKYPHEIKIIDRSQFLMGSPDRDGINHIFESTANDIDHDPFPVNPKFKECPESLNSKAGLRLYHISCTTDIDGSRRNMVDGKAILDVGCFRGCGSAYMGRGLNASEVLGVDISLKTINYAKIVFGPESPASFKNKGKNSVYFERLNMLEGARKIGEKRFDIAMCVQTISTIPNQVLFFENINSALKDDGLLVICDLLPGRNLEDVRNSVERQLTLAGFRVESVQSLSDGVRQGLGEIRGLDGKFTDNLPGFPVLVHAKKINHFSQ